MMVGVACLMTSVCAHAVLSTTSVTTLNYLSSYTQFGSGDVIFRVANPTGDCFGYWISKTDPGYQANMAMLLAAYQSKTPILIAAMNDQLWTGSGNAYCKLWNVDYR